VALNVNRYGLAIRSACRAAKVPAWSPHSLRHSLASEVARRSGSVEVAAAAIGDAPDTARRVYVHTDPAERVRREEELLSGGVLTVSELRTFGIGKNKAFDLMAAGRLPYTQLDPGGKRLIPWRAVLALLAAGLVGGAAK
jgi:hypothetical protein